MQRLTRRAFLNRSLLVGMGAVLASPMSAHAADLTIRLAWYMPPHTTVADQGETLAKAIETLSEGKIKVATYPAGSLLNSDDMADGLRNNTANMGIFGMQWWARYEPSLSWDNIRFLIKDPAAVQTALHGKLGDLVNEKFRKHGVEAIAWGYYGYGDDYINNKKPIKKPSDLKGLKLRAMGDVSASYIKSQGGSPTAVASGEVYTAMQRGTLDGGASGISTFVSRKWYETGKYAIAFRSTPVIYPVQVNAKWWAGLTDEQRDVIARAARSTEADVVKSINAEYDSGMEALRQHGVEIYVPEGDVRDEWERTSQDVMVPAYLKRAGDQGKQILDVFHAELAGKQ